MKSSLTIQVPFSFPRPATTIAPVTHGQKFMWDLLLLTPENLAFNNVGFMINDTNGVTIDEVRSIVLQMLDRNESLRTVFHVIDERHTQELLTSGEISVECWLSSDGGDDDARAMSLYSWLVNQPFAMSDFPARVGCVVDNETVKRLVLVFSHMAIDGGGVPVLRKQLLSALQNGGLYPNNSGSVRQPIEQAAWEQAELGRRSTSQSALYWKNALSKFPPRMFEINQDGQAAEEWQELSFFSRRMGDCVEVLERFYRTSDTTIVLTMLLHAMAKYAQKDYIATTICTSNRFHQHVEDSVGTFAQDIPLYAKIGHVDMSSLIEEIQDNLYTSYQYGLGDPLEITRISRTAHNGFPVSLDSRINVHYEKSALHNSSDRSQDLSDKIDRILTGSYIHGKDFAVSWSDGVPHLGKSLYVMSYSPRKILFLCNLNYMKKTKVEEMAMGIEETLLNLVLEIHESVSC
ncbi:condensation domain-containing protein [Agrobacterium leguminum]|uniref:Condensation domain-containing protein n=1 Tax=Agrobacterium deltaense NCPPB 1641 TaxID=1183425 RepID=A0A1S7TRX4_9HYPH|nr:MULTISPECIES: condensation domain-containing protein [Agrobacterium]WFS69304.1 condensation domain-containing protein [Agrobacterium leguminum]CVI57349.1 hypothetical protein AGR7A_Lc10044 [Agrobacterium deltaense NCPPB 1641]